jgi:tRNA modification GTPase
LDILAEIEAHIDFEEDLPPLDEPSIVRQLQGVTTEVERLLATADRGELLRTGIKVAIVGRPNVGKSSLLNAWSRSDRAIVTNLPGTTRDVVESSLVVRGIPVQVLDTAGIRETEDLVEKMGVARSHGAAQQADLVLLTIDAASGWTPEDQQLYETLADRLVILVINKTDLASAEQVHYPAEIQTVVNTVAAQQQGIEGLEAAITQTIERGKLQAANLEFAINQRQAEALTRANAALHHVMDSIEGQFPLDFWSIDVRGAIQALGEITGEDVTESVLDRIFSRFCIGK